MSATPQYGIGVAKNRFELIDIEDEDPLEILKRNEREKEEKRKAKLAEKENKTKQLPPTKPKTQKILKESQKTKAPVEIQKTKEDKKIKLKKDLDITEKGDNRDYSTEKKWFDDEPNFQENGVGNERERRDIREYSSDGFQRGRGRRGFPRGVFVRGGGGGGSGVGGGRGGSRGGFQRSFDSRGKREYDRQSGSDKTGVKPVDKKDGAGAHNWGNPQDDWDNQQDEWANQQDDQQDDWSPTNQGQSNADKSPKAEVNLESVPSEEAALESGEAVKEGEQGQGPQTENENEDKPEMTLDEWKAMKMPRQQPSYNIRKPGEGEDLTRWKKMYALEKKKEEEEESDDEYEYELCEYPQRVGRQKRILDIDIKFKDARGGGERGRGRGFGRGGGPRGGGPRAAAAAAAAAATAAASAVATINTNNNQDRDMPPAPKVDDEKAFPSLV